MPSFSTVLSRPPQQLQDRRQRKAARLEKAHLTGLFALVVRRLAEAALPQREQRGFVIQLDLIDRGLDRVSCDTGRLQLFDDPAPTVVSAFANDDRPGVTGIRQEAFGGERIEHGAYLASFAASREQPLLQLRARVLPPRKKTDRAIAKRGTRQWPYSASAPRTGPGEATPTASRILPSISAAISGCSLR
jgi:hypothetical protein